MLCRDNKTAELDSMIVGLLSYFHASQGATANNDEDGALPIAICS